MILKQVHNNKIGAYAFMLLVLIVLWVIPVLKSDVITASIHSKMPLWNLLSPLVKNNWVSLLSSFFCALFIVLGITRYNTRYSLLQSQSALPGFIFILLAGSIPSIQHLSPIWLSAIFIILSFGYLFEAYNYRKTMKECFLASFWIAVGSLFSYKIVLLFPLILLVMSVLRILSFKSFLATIIGFILPWIFVLGYELALGSIDDFLFYIEPTKQKLIWSYDFSSITLIYFGVLLLLLFVSIIKVVNELGKKKIFTRKQYNSVILTTLYIVVVVIITGGGKEIMPLVSIFISLLISHLIGSLTSWLWQNIFFFSVVALTIIGQLFL